MLARSEPILREAVGSDGAGASVLVSWLARWRSAMTSTSHTEEGGTYHHGDLPQTLMNLALDQIREAGTEKLSLRALARAAGVSPTAPYRHFATKQCLLAAIATEGFHLLRVKNAAVRTADAPVEQRMLDMSLAYVEFALDNPTRYQLMFGSLLGDFSKYEMLHRASAAAYEEVDEILEEMIDARRLTVSAELLGGMLWSFLHGMALLLIQEVDSSAENSKPLRAIDAMRQDPEAAIRSMLAGLFSGAAPGSS